MKKLLLIFFVLLTIVMTGCTFEEPEHEHAYAYYMDATYHWKAPCCNWNEYNCEELYSHDENYMIEKGEHIYGEWKRVDYKDGDEDFYYIGRTCEVCRRIQYCNHVDQKWTIIKDATVQEEGIKHFDCDICGFSGEESIPKVYHHFTHTWELSDSNADNHIYKCKLCLETMEKPHTFEIISQKNSTCTEKGFKVHKCSECSFQKTEELRLLSHVFESYEYDDTYHWRVCKTCSGIPYGKTKHDLPDKDNIDNLICYPLDVVIPATCTSPRKLIRNCACGYSRKPLEYGSKLGHDYLNGKCTRCDEAPTVTDTMMRVKGSEYEFYIFNTEVTYARWCEVENWAKNNGFSMKCSYTGTYEPVQCSWENAVIWCNAASLKDGLSPVYYSCKYGSKTPIKVIKSVDDFNQIDREFVNLSDMGFVMQDTANGYRLPSKSEWKFAADGGQQYTYSGSNNVDDVAWYSSNTTKISRVMKKAPNGYSLYDMSGNVEEWCQDSINSNSSSLIKRAACGGSYKDYNARCASSSFVWHECQDLNGFRPVRNVD